MLFLFVVVVVVVVVVCFSVVRAIDERILVHLKRVYKETEMDTEAMRSLISVMPLPFFFLSILFLSSSLINLFPFIFHLLSFFLSSSFIPSLPLLFFHYITSPHTHSHHITTTQTATPHPLPPHSSFIHSSTHSSTHSLHPLLHPLFPSHVRSSMGVQGGWELWVGGGRKGG